MSTMLFSTRRAGALVLAMVATTVACDDNGTEPLPADVPLDQLADVVLDTDDLLGSVLDQQASSMSASPDLVEPLADLIVTDASFTRTRTCPAGGSVLVEGTAHRERDTETHVVESEYAGSRTKSDCAHERGEYTITVNGSADWTASRRRVEGAFDGLQVSTHVGSFSAVRNDGAEKSCDFDVEVVRDPDAGTKTITGTICGNPVDKTKDWNPGF